MAPKHVGSTPKDINDGCLWVSFLPFKKKKLFLSFTLEYGFAYVVVWAVIMCMVMSIRVGISHKVSKDTN